MALEQDKNMEHSILETAERLFLDKGFAMTSTTEIAREVGCNQALVHYYFRTKENLFEKIFESKAQVLFSILMNEEDSLRPFEERLRSLIEGHFDLLSANPKLPFLFFNELITNPSRLEKLIFKLKVVPKTAFAKFESDFQAEIEKGRIRPMDLSTLLLTVVSLNLMPFLAKPIFLAITNTDDEHFKLMIEERRRENVRIIMRSLVP